MSESNWRLYVAIPLILTAVGFGWWLTHDPRPPEVVLVTQFPEVMEDYASARAKFTTKLLKHGEAPQAYGDSVSPDDVDEVEFPSGDLSLKAWITAEPEVIRRQKPAVLFLHGGFSFSEFDWQMAQPFEDAGFVVMIPMLRGENGLEGHYSMFYHEVDDVLAAADYLAKQPHVDPDRIFIAGHSVGGTLSMLATMASNRFVACASFSGSPDQPKWAKLQMEVVPFDPHDEQEMRMRSPLAFPGSFKAPAKLYYGEDEGFFSVSTQELARNAKAAGCDVEAIAVPGDHETMTLIAIPRAIHFFTSILKGQY